MDDKTKHLSDALDWIKEHAPDGAALVEKALAETAPYTILGNPDVPCTCQGFLQPLDCPRHGVRRHR